ncbi:hypothetical protein [Corynebacterium sp. AOP12-C2-36]|uniref:hypothetical protein n=1 Tax=Corynebacterium sp. AOP12-C2-36 TaxID=3457723 RepID=UPI0040332DF9
MYPKAASSFARRVAGLFGAVVLSAGLVACGSEDNLEPTAGTADFRAQDCPRVEPTDTDGISVDGAVGWGDARRGIQEQERRCASEKDMDQFFASFEEPEGESGDPEPTRSPGGESGVGGSLPGFSVAAVDAAADGSLETKPVERNDEDFDLPVETPTPGISVGFKDASGWQACTLSFLGEKAGNVVGVTAGHCNRDSTDGQAFWKPGGVGDPTALGSFPADYCYSKATCGDHTEISMTSGVGAVDGKIAGRYAISGVMDPDELTPSMELCKYGRVTGESCGKVMGREGHMGRAGIPARPGDSGAPVYAKDGDSVKLVGILSGAPAGADGAVTDFTLAAPTIKALGIDRVL